MKKVLTALTLLLVSTAAFSQTVDLPVKKFDPYASIRFAVGYHELAASGTESELDMVYRLQTNSRIGAKMEIGAIKTHVELGLNNSSGVNVRLAYATYDAGFAQLLVGQAYTPYTWSASGDYFDDAGFAGFGVTYDARQPQIMVSSNGFYISCVNPSRVTTGLTGSGTSGVIKDTTIVVPKTAIGYDFKSESTVVGFGGAANMVKINDPVSPVDGKNIISYVAYLHANIVIGDFILRGNAAYSQNAGNFGIVDVVAGNSDTIQTSGTGVNALSVAKLETATSTSFKNSINMEGYINPMIKVTPELTIGAGYGYAQVENDLYAETDKQQAYFIDARYSINKNFHILPEFSYRDFMKSTAGADQGHEYYAGAQLQLNI